MLKTDPNERISASDAYHNQWIQRNAPNIPLNTKMFNNLKNFHVINFYIIHEKNIKNNAK